MAKPDWGAIQKQFLADHAITNISPKEWCEAHAISYVTARRYVKKTSADVFAGRKRLQLHATCPHTDKSPGTTSLDDGTSARLTDAAQRDYFTLRGRIETSNKMIAGLQAYIKQQCLTAITQNN